MRPLKSTTDDDSDDEQIPAPSEEVGDECYQIISSNGDLPGAVVRLAAEIQCGNHPMRLDWLDYKDMSSDSTWEKLAACGSPTYVHKPSGFAVTLGQADTAAIIKPGQLRPDALMTMAIDAVDIERYNTTMTVRGLVDAEDVYDLADEYEDKQL